MDSPRHQFVGGWFNIRAITQKVRRGVADGARGVRWWGENCHRSPTAISRFEHKPQCLLIYGRFAVADTPIGSMGARALARTAKLAPRLQCRGCSTSIQRVAYLRPAMNVNMKQLVAVSVLVLSLIALRGGAAVAGENRNEVRASVLCHSSDVCVRVVSTQQPIVV